MVDVAAMVEPSAILISAIYEAPWVLLSTIVDSASTWMYFRIWLSPLRASTAWTRVPPFALVTSR